MSNGQRPSLDGVALDQIFRDARTQNGFLDRPVAEAQLHELYELLKWAPTSNNTAPARFVFLHTREAKERLRPALFPGNLEKTLSAPVTDRNSASFASSGVMSLNRIPRLGKSGTSRIAARAAAATAAVLAAGSIIRES